MATMYDSTNPGAIPADAEIVAGYVDGRFAWPAGAWARFSGRKVRIAVFASTNDGEVGDVENGDMTPESAAGWVIMRRAAGVAVPTLYMNRDNRAAVESACAARGLVPGVHFDLGVATLDGTVDVPGVAFIQYAGAALSGGDYDLSVTAPWWPRGGDVLTADDQAFIASKVEAGPDYMVAGVTPGPAPGEILTLLRSINDAALRLLPGILNALATELDTIKTELAAGEGPTTAAAVARIEAALQAAGKAEAGA